MLPLGPPMPPPSLNERAAESADRGAMQAPGRSVAGWRVAQVETLFELPFNDLLHRAHSSSSRAFRSQRGPAFDPDFGQDRRLSRGLRLLPAGGALSHRRRQRGTLSVEQVTAAARVAKANGATRFCMGAAWRGPKAARPGPRDRDGEGGAGARAGNVRDARPAEGGAGGAAQGRRGSTITTTTSTPRPSSTARSSPRAPRTIASPRSSACAGRVCTSAAAASSAWERTAGRARR